MPIHRHSQIHPGTLVSIVLKADQRTGKQVQGTVAQLLTRGDHPRGIKVRLTDGRVGRVQQLLTSNLPPSTRQTQPPPRKFIMSSGQNPWQTSSSQGNPYTAADSEDPQYQQQQYQQHESQYQSQQRESQQPQYHSNQQQQQSNQQQFQQSSGYDAPPAPPPRGIQRSDTDALLLQEPDRAAQVEHMQNYEASANETEDDKNQATLQKEFPNLDSSLIAAIYGDSKKLGETREMLQELNSAS